MPVKYIRDGSIFDSPCEAWVNPVNCVGVMGAGLAGEFRKLYPPMFTSYRSACLQGDLKIGRIHVWEVDVVRENGVRVVPDHLKFILNFPTMHDPGQKAQARDLVAGVNALADVVEQRHIKSIALPALGCGIGRLSWGACVDLIEGFAERVPHVEIEAYEPKDNRFLMDPDLKP
jgi:O-acetyl-ADP-ribose deacetylase (regulator of RNase III)